MAIPITAEGVGVVEQFECKQVAVIISLSLVACTGIYKLFEHSTWKIL